MPRYLKHLHSLKEFWLDLVYFLSLAWIEVDLDPNGWEEADDWKDGQP